MLTQSSQKSQQVSKNPSGSQPSTLRPQTYNTAKKKEVPYVKQVISIEDFNQEEREVKESKNIRGSSAINNANNAGNSKNLIKESVSNDKKVVKNAYHNIEVKKTDRDEIVQKKQLPQGFQEKQQVQQKASEHYLMQLQMKEQMKAIQKAQQLKQQQAKELNMLARKQVLEQLLSQNEQQQEGEKKEIKTAVNNTADRHRIQKNVEISDLQKNEQREQGDRNFQTKSAARNVSSEQSSNLPKDELSGSQVENDKKNIRKHPQSSKNIESNEDIIKGASNSNPRSMQRINGVENGRDSHIKSQNLSEKQIQINNFSSSSSNNNSQVVILNNSKRLLKHSTKSERFPIHNKGSQVMEEEEKEEKMRKRLEINKSQKLKESQKIQKKNEETQQSSKIVQQGNHQKKRRLEDENDENGDDQKSESEERSSEHSNNKSDDEGYFESKYRAFGQYESVPVKLQDNQSKLSQESKENEQEEEGEDEVVERKQDTQEEVDQDDSDNEQEDEGSQCSDRQKLEGESGGEGEEEQEVNDSQEDNQQDEQENENERQQEEEEEQEQQESENDDDASESEERNEKKTNNLDDNLTFGHHKTKQLLHQNFQTFGPNRNNSENNNNSLVSTLKQQDNNSRNVEQSQGLQQSRKYQESTNNQSIKKSQGSSLEGYHNSGLASTSAFGALKDKMRELKGGSIKNNSKEIMNDEDNQNQREVSSEGSREEEGERDDEEGEGGYQDQDQYEEEEEIDKQNEEEQEESEWIENKNSQVSLGEEEGRNERNSFDMKFHMAYEQSQEQSFRVAHESHSIEHNKDGEDDDGDACDDFWQGKASSKMKPNRNHKEMDASELQDNEFIKHSILEAHRQTGQQSVLSEKSTQPRQSNHRKTWEKTKQTQQTQDTNYGRKSQQHSEENGYDDGEDQENIIEEDATKKGQEQLEQEEDNSQQQQQQQTPQQQKGVTMTINFDEDDEDAEKKKKIFEQLRHRKTQEFEINKQKKRLAEQQNQQQQSQQTKEQQYLQPKPHAKSPIGARKTGVEDSLQLPKERQSLPNRQSSISHKPSEKLEKKGNGINDPVKDYFMLPQKSTPDDNKGEKQTKNKTSPGILKKKQATAALTSDKQKQDGDESKLKTDIADNFAPRPSVSETPTTKPRMPFQKASNKLLISQAISKVCMAGPNQKERETVLNKMKESPYEHFIDFKALYAMDNNATEIKKIYGLNTAPQIIEQTGIQTFFRYDSGAKEFKELLVKAFSSQVDAILLKK